MTNQNGECLLVRTRNYLFNSCYENKALAYPVSFIQPCADCY